MCREAGALVRTNVLLRDFNLPVNRPDERRLEVLAAGLPLYHGAQLAIDTTLVSPLTAAGAPRRYHGATAGAAISLARQRKARTYPEFAQASRCRLVVLAIELGGRWGQEAVHLVRDLARARARAAPRIPQEPRLAYSKPARRRPGWLGGARSSRVRRNALTRPHTSNGTPPPPCPRMDNPPSLAPFSLTTRMPRPSRPAYRPPGNLLGPMCHQHENSSWKKA
eukprot:Skav210411  [mRNA]  locus=scaffold1416:432086:432754:- [translate_table: standard]